MIIVLVKFTVKSLCMRELKHLCMKCGFKVTNIG